MADVFVSYKREDGTKVQRFVDHLKSIGLDVWFDVRIHSGEDYTEVIHEELSNAKAVLVCWSIESCRSRWVRSEASNGLDQLKLVSLSLEKCSPFPPFTLIQTENLEGWDGNWAHPSWQKIVERIGSLVGRPGLVGAPGKPGLCEAKSDPSGQKLAAWAKHYPNDPYVPQIMWAARQRDEFNRDLEILRKQADDLQSQFRSKIDNLSQSFDIWVSQGRDADPSRRPDPRLLTASLLGQAVSSLSHSQTATSAGKGASEQKRRSRMWSSLFALCIVGLVLLIGLHFYERNQYLEQITSLSRHASEIEGLLNSATRDNSELKAKLEKALATSDVDRKSLEADERRVDDINRQKAALQTSMDDARRQLDALAKALTAKTSDLEIAKRDLAAALNSRDSLEKQVAELKQVSDDRIRTLQTQVSALTNERNDSAMQLRQLRADLEKANSRVTDLVKASSASLSTRDSLKLDLKAALEKSSSLQRQVDELLGKLKQQDDNLAKEVKNLETERDDLAKHLSQTQSDLKAANAKIESLSQSLTNADEVSRDLAAAQSNVASLQTRLEQSQNQYDEATHRIAELEKTNETLQRRLMDLEKSSTHKSQTASKIFRRIRNFSIEGHDLSQTHLGDVEKCESQCQNTSECKAYTFDDWNNICFLKREIGLFYLNPRSQTGYPRSASAEKAETPITIKDHKCYFPGKGYSSKIAGSYKDCNASCKEEESCIAYSYDDTSKMCTLFQRTGQFDSTVEDHHCGSKLQVP